VVARAIHRQIAEGKGAFLDARAAIGAAFAARFPAVAEACREAGIDPAQQPIPVAPAAHYHMGGVLADATGRTSLDGLWACGEVAATGLHGANRLASNSLLEGLVFAARVADDIQGLVPSVRRTPWEERHQPAQPATSADNGAVARLRRLMAGKVGVLRDGDDLAHALGALRRLEAEAATPPALRAMATAGLLVTAAAWKRTETRGSHARTDFLAADPAQARRTFLRLDEARAIAAAAAPRALERA
jgi:L-aspartate oxidase